MKAVGTAVAQGSEEDDICQYCLRERSGNEREGQRRASDSELGFGVGGGEGKRGQVNTQNQSYMMGARPNCCREL